MARVKALGAGLYGFAMRGVVVKNDDPLSIGRVKVRVYNIHGTPQDGIQDENLPWAFPCFPTATYNSGTYIVPEEGNTVLLVFEDGDLSKPVYLAGVS